MRYEQEDKLAQGNELVIYRGGRCGGLLLHPVSHIQKEHTQRYILHFTIPQLSSVGSRVVALWLACAVIAFLGEVARITWTTNNVTSSVQHQYVNEPNMVCEPER